MADTDKRPDPEIAKRALAEARARRAEIDAGADESG